MAVADCHTDHMSNIMTDAQTAKRLDDTIESLLVDDLSPEHCRATTLLAAIRVALTTLPNANDINEGAAGLIIDVLHAQTEDWLRRETE